MDKTEVLIETKRPKVGSNGHLWYMLLNFMGVISNTGRYILMPGSGALMLWPRALPSRSPRNSYYIRALILPHDFDFFVVGKP